MSVEKRFRGEGIAAGLLAEARENDLLVVGLPTEGGTEDKGLMEELWDNDLTLLRQAECNMLVVVGTVRETRTILVNYQGGLEGKMALRLAGAWGEKAAARVVALSIDSDPARAASLTNSATQYLKGYALVEVKAVERPGDPNSELRNRD